MYNAIVDPESDDGTGLVEGLKEAGKAATDSGRGNFGDVDGRYGGDASYAHASEEASSENKAQLAVGDCTILSVWHNIHGTGGRVLTSTHDDRSATTEELEEWVHQQCSYQASS